MTGPVLFEQQEGVGYVTLNRPAAGNAIDVPLARALLEATLAAEADDKVRCVVLRGAGRMFCVGGDVTQLYAAGHSLPSLLEEILSYLHPAILRLAQMSKPVVAAVHGPAAGAGIGLAAVGDIALAEPAAHFTMAYSKIGLSPDGGATWLLPRLIGLRRAQELSLTNRRVSAEEAAEIGLVTRVVPEGTLAHEASALARELVDGAVGALGQTRRLLMASANASFAAQLDDESRTIALQGAAVEGKLGVSAFAERRKPDFRGGA